MTQGQQTLELLGLKGLHTILQVSVFKSKGSSQSEVMSH